MIDFFKAWFNWGLLGLRIGWWRFRYRAVERAFVFVRQGVYYDLVLAHRIHQGKLGEIYTLGREVCYVFNDFLRDQSAKRNRDFFEVYEDERVLFVVDGEVVACPVQGTGVPMDADLLSMFNQGNWGKQLADSIEQEGKGWDLGKLKWLLVVVAILIIGYVIYKFVLHGAIPGMEGNVTLPTPIPTQIPTPWIFQK